jgi:hypothetical protein
VETQARRAPQGFQQRFVGRRHRHQCRLVPEAGRRQRRIAGGASETHAAVDLVARDVPDHQQVHAIFYHHRHPDIGGPDPCAMLNGTA